MHPSTATLVSPDTLLSDILRSLDLTVGLDSRRDASVIEAPFRLSRLLDQGYSWIADVTIHDAAGSARHVLVQERLRRLGVRDPAALDRLLDVLAHATPEASPAGRGLPRDSRLTAVLIDAYLRPVDEAMGSEVGYLRHEDRLICLTRDQPSAFAAHNRLAQLLARGGQRPDAGRSSVSRIEPGWRWLGWRVDRRGRLVRAQSSDLADVLERGARRQQRGPSRWRSWERRLGL